MEVSEVRRRVRAAIESARATAQERRVRTDRAALEYQEFLRDRAVPLFQTVASALVAEGYRFKVFTPADSVRLASEASGTDFIELVPRHHRRSAERGRPLQPWPRQPPASPASGRSRTNVAIADLSDEDVMAFLMEEIAGSRRSAVFSLFLWLPASPEGCVSRS